MDIVWILSGYLVLRVEGEDTQKHTGYKDGHKHPSQPQLELYDGITMMYVGSQRYEY